MRTLVKLVVLGLMSASFAVVACSDDDDDNVEGTGGEETTGGNGSGGDDEGSGGDDESTGGNGHAGNGNGTGGETGEEITLDGEIDEDMTLEAKNTYTLENFVYVPDGVTLTIEPGTVIKGDKTTLGTLVIERGGKIEAKGTASNPIVFTAATSDPEPGDWGGIILLGRAPNSMGEDVNIEGTASDDRHQFGGDEPDDSSGTLEYVIIEYPGINLGQGKEINGLSMGSVGSGTKINHIAIRYPLDDCFEWFGGTVDADHLICENPDDDMFDTDDGYQGTLSYLFGRHGVGQSDDPHGFEWDGTTDTDGAIDTEVRAENVTLCGGADIAFSMMLRKGITGEIDNLAAVGFAAGYSLLDGADTGVEITNSTLNVPALSPDDDGFDSWFLDGDGNSVEELDFDADDCLDEDGPTDAVKDSGVGAFADGGDWIDFAY